MALSASLTPQTAACKDVHTRSLDGTSQGHFKGRQGTSRGYSLDGTSQPAKRLKMLPARTHIHDEILCLQLRFDHIVKHTIVALDSVLVASGKTGLKISARWDNAGHTQHVLAKFLTVVEGRDLQTNGETLTAMQCDGVGTTYCRLVVHLPVQLQVTQNHTNSSKKKEKEKKEKEKEKNIQEGYRGIKKNSSQKTEGKRHREPKKQLQGTESHKQLEEEGQDKKREREIGINSQTNSLKKDPGMWKNAVGEVDHALIQLMHSSLCSGAIALCT
eukprot:1136280-Pelagomonas_calceolata.AAC.2